MKIIGHALQNIDQKTEVELEAIRCLLAKRGIQLLSVEKERQLTMIEKWIVAVRTKMALQIKKGKGECVGHIQFGQKLAQDSIHLETNQEELEVIWQIATLQAQRLSVRKIAKLMNALKSFNRGGAPWNHESIHKLTKKINKQKL